RMENTFYNIVALICLCLFLCFNSALAEKLDINSASLEELKNLPISETEAEAIYHYILYGGPLESIYDLRNISYFEDTEKFIDLRPLIVINPPEADDDYERLDHIEYKIENWIFEEGVNENISDLWIDIALSRVNVNVASMQELLTIPGMTPQDALKILKYREDMGSIDDQRELRSIPGITGYGYANARDLVSYQVAQSAPNLKLHYQSRLTNSPYDEEENSLFTENFSEDDSIYDSWYNRLNFSQPIPQLSHKLKIGYRNFEGGLLAYRPYGGEIEGNHYYNPFDYPTSKFFLGVSDLSYGPILLDKLILGNYYISLGQGVVLENTDAFKPRKSGFYNNQRFVGLMGDLSTTSQYQFKGMALQARLYDKFSLLTFYSKDKKDAVLRPDSTGTNQDNFFSSYINTGNLINNQVLEEAGLLPIQDVLNEEVLGTNLEFRPLNHLSVGLTYLRLNYDRRYYPDIYSYTDTETFQERGTLVDNEYLRLSPSGGRHRAVSGFHFQFIHDIFSVQGEYGELNDDGNLFKIGDEPKAMVLSLLTHLNKLNLLVLYRNYDLAYDNPYCRSFSNYERYKGTIFSKPYYLDNPLYGYVFINSAQPQSEEGFYLNTWYRLSSKITLGMEYDTWYRKADNANYDRLVMKLSYQPLHGIRFNLRQKWQNRNGDNIITDDRFTNLETRFSASFRLSRYDEINMLYSLNNTYFPPKPRFSFDIEADGSKPISGDVVSPGEALGVEITHNFNDNLRATIAGMFYKGFLWNFEEGEFVILETEENDAFRYWIAFKDNISKNLVVRAKYSWDYEYPISDPDLRGYTNQPEELDYEINKIQRSTESFRLQIDYFWW
ncbi:helix-hairpin-helix domain-containing protein, partial [bacterium]|nr:helix-hairpin-helix domain-containing protein [bacterium]